MRRMVLVGLVGLVSLTGCSNPFSNSSAPASVVTSPVASDSPTPSATTSTTPPVSQQTGEPNPSPFVTPTISGGAGPKPACGSVWIDGLVLPANYDGCIGGPKADEQMLDCNTGPNFWIRNMPDGSEYYAFAGKLINHSKDPNADAADTGKCMS